MAPKAQPRKPPARRVQNTNQEDESGKALSQPSAKESFAEDQANGNESLHEMESIEASEMPSSHNEPEASSTPVLTVDSPPPRQPAQQLTSVLPQGSPAISPALDGETRPAALKFKPKSFIRRSKEEREAVEKAEAERRAERLAAEGKLSTSDRGGLHSRGRGRGSGFGDMNRWKNERFNLSHGASGHLGGSTFQEASAGRRGRGGGRTGGASGGRSEHVGSSDSVVASSTGTSTRMKKEPTIKPEKDKGGDIAVGSSTSNPKRKRTKIKKEDQAPTYVSSEGECDSDGAVRVDIEKINLVTDDEVTDNDMPPKSEVAKGKQRQRVPHMRQDGLRPVRIQRQEHVERAVGVNTDASSLTSAELRRRAKERSDAEESLFLPEGEEQDVLPAPKMKGKRKPRDVEFVRNERKWKGVYQDEDDNDAGVKIKDEHKDDDDVMVTDPPMHEGDTSAMDIDEEEPVPLSEAVDKPLTAAKKLQPAPTEAQKSSQTLQGDDLDESEEERASMEGHKLLTAHDKWNQDYKDLITYIEEINSLFDDFSPKPSTSTNPLSTDANPISSDHSADVFDTDSQPIYIFQLPPLLPSLRDPTKKRALSPEEKKPKAKPPPSEPPNSTNPFATAPLIKEDPDTKPDPDASSLHPTIPHTYIASHLHLPAGQTGTLSVHKGAKISAVWGGSGGKAGLAMEVSKTGDGAKMGMPAELVLTKWEESCVKREGEGGWEDRVGVGEKGWGMGRVRPGFVGVPDLGGMIG